VMKQHSSFISRILNSYSSNPKVKYHPEILLSGALFDTVWLKKYSCNLESSCVGKTCIYAFSSQWV